MAAERREFILNATPGQAWAYLERPESWPEWDPDLVSVEDGTPAGIAEGRSWNIGMKTPKKGKLLFSDVVEGREFTWTVRALGGMIQGVGHFIIDAAEDPNKTDFTYDFEMKGALGAMLWRFQRELVVKGIDEGAENLKKYVG